MQVVKSLLFHPFGYIIDLYFTGMVEKVIDLKVTYPQIRTCICNFCGSHVYFDLWGLPVRQKCADGGIRFECRCDVVNGPYFRVGSNKYGEHPPCERQR